MQIAQLRAELESSELMISQLKEQLKKTSDEKNILLRTTEIYAADKRELQNEVQH